MSFTGTPDEFLTEILNLPRVVAESVSPDLAWVAFSLGRHGRRDRCLDHADRGNGAADPHHRQ